MVPKASRAFRWQLPCLAFLPCLALRRQLTARRLAGCCRVDARFTLAFRTLASGRWPLDTGPVGHWLPSALVALALVIFGSGWCEKPAQSTADHPTTDPTDSPDDYQEFLYEIWVTETVKTPRRLSQLIPLRSGGRCLSSAAVMGREVPATGLEEGFAENADPAEGQVRTARAAHHGVIYEPTGLVVIALRKASGEATVEMVCVRSPTP